MQPLGTGPERGRDGQLEDGVVVEPGVAKAHDVLVGYPIGVPAHELQVVREREVIGVAREGRAAGLRRRGALALEDRLDEARDVGAQPGQPIGSESSS